MEILRIQITTVLYCTNIRDTVDLQRAVLFSFREREGGASEDAIETFFKPTRAANVKVAHAARDLVWSYVGMVAIEEAARAQMAGGKTA